MDAVAPAPVIADNGGLRYSEGKPRYDLLPPEFLAALANHYGVGAKKYADRNWERGMKWGEPIRAILSHSAKFMAGEDFDAETGSLHTTAIGWNAAALVTYYYRGIGVDDRSKGAGIPEFFPGTLENAKPAAKEDGVPGAASVGVAWGDPNPARKFTYWYLATPYTKFPGGHQAAFILACRLTADLMWDGVPVYCPIAHSHPVSLHGLDNVDHDFWMRTDAPMMDAATGLIVVMAESWDESRGMAEEIKRFEAAGKPIRYWDPATGLSAEILAAAAAGWERA